MRFSNVRAISIIGSVYLLGVLGAGAQPRFSADFNSGIPPAGATLYGSATIANSGGITNSGVLKLTTDGTGLQGGLIIEDFNAGEPVTEFTARMKIHIGEGTSRPADGFSFSFGPDIPNGSIGEEGAGTGIRVTLDTFDNNSPDTAPALELFVGSTSVAFQSMAGEREGSRATDGPLITDPATGQSMTLRNGTDEYSDLIIRLKTDSTIDVIYKNVLVLSNIATEYVPTAGRFALAACRT